MDYAYETSSFVRNGYWPTRSIHSSSVDNDFTFIARRWPIDILHHIHTQYSVW